MTHREGIMEKERRSSLDTKETSDNVRNRDNTEYVATRCRITKPIPPKPATNPMQFVKITPCPLVRQAQEQMKKAEEVKTVRQGIRDEAEDWQANLDNWKSSRRKRQEHIIERVVEVKKFEQQEMEKNRRKSKTFNEILEDRHKRKSKLSISLYDTDDSNDLSDYGIGLGHTSKTSYSNSSSNTQIDGEKFNSDSDSDKCKEPSRTETNERLNTEIRDSQNNKWIETDNNEFNKKEDYTKKSWERNQFRNKIEEQSDTWSENDSREHSEERSQMEVKNENELKTEKNIHNEEEKLEIRNESKEHKENSIQTDENRKEENQKSSFDLLNEETLITSQKEENEQLNWENNINEPNKQEQQYTYESAIQGYRTRVKSNLNNGNFFSHLNSQQNTEKTDEEANIIVPKGSILKRKELFENEKTYELNSYESIASRRLCEDFVHSQSLKERLMSLEKYTEQPLTSDESGRIPESKPKSTSNRSSMLESIKADLEANKNNAVINNWDNKSDTFDRSSSPETNLFVNKIEKFHCSLDNLAGDTDRDGSECGQSNYPASNSSTELLGLSSQYCDTDREDSGIHTADVSCSVSQADEPVEDSDINTNSSNEKFTSPDSARDMPPVDLVIQTLPWNNNIYTFDNVFSSEEFPLGLPKTPLEPPKEKPPPPPMNLVDDDLPEEELKRINSTRRIKKELRMKRSSFLGINPDDQIDDETNVGKPPPDINSFLQKESRLEKQMYKKTQGSYSEAGDSQDSGVELERGRLSTDTWCNSIPDCSTTPVHGRQDSGPCTTNSITSEEDEIIKKEREIIELVEKEERWRGRNECEFIKPDLSKSRSAPKLDLTETIAYDTTTESASSIDDEHDEILRVKQELLQLEREEMERQRENMIFRESQARAREPRNGLRKKRLSLEDISHPMQQHMYMYQPDSDYRKSMPELQHEMHLSNYSPYGHPIGVPTSRSMHTSPVKYKKPMINERYERDMYMSGNQMDHSDPCLYQHTTNVHKHVPRPVARHSLRVSEPITCAPRMRNPSHDAWLKPRQSAGDMREKFNYSQHWLIQEAEQRRISEQQKFLPHSTQSWKITRPEKHLPDSVIQTLTQRVQNKVGLQDKNVLGKRMDNMPNIYNSHSPHSVGHAQLHHSHLMEESQDKMLSVSGKKKCSYCENELGRGAAMIIESLCLFYHMDCFKCCVCHVQLGDGLMGTDVRVRNNKLHCHNCYSSDDGVKFSCV